VSGSILDVAPVMPVVIIEDPADAVPLARAVVTGGIAVIEVTLHAAGARGHPGHRRARTGDEAGGRHGQLA
jgi:hypothetical protein